MTRSTTWTSPLWRLMTSCRPCPTIDWYWVMKASTLAHWLYRLSFLCCSMQCGRPIISRNRCNKLRRSKPCQTWSVLLFVLVRKTVVSCLIFIARRRTFGGHGPPGSLDVPIVSPPVYICCGPLHGVFSASSIIYDNITWECVRGWCDISCNVNFHFKPCIAETCRQRPTVNFSL